MNIKDLNFNIKPSKIMVFGRRCTGKTTLIRNLFQNKKDYFSNIMLMAAKRHDYSLNENFYSFEGDFELLR